MLPITLVETDRDDFDTPVVELWRGEAFVGMVFYDGTDSIVQIYPASEGEVHDLDVNEIQTLLDTAVRIVDPDVVDGELAALHDATAHDDWSSEHPATVELLGEFDSLAVHRTKDGEGFFDRTVAHLFIAKCEELDLAVVEMEGFEVVSGELTALPALDLAVTPQSIMSWQEFRTYANATASSALSSWPDRESMAIAFVFQQPDAEIIVA
jgi:hypothetical protein